MVYLCRSFFLYVFMYFALSFVLDFFRSPVVYRCILFVSYFFLSLVRSFVSSIVISFVLSFVSSLIRQLFLYFVIYLVL